MITKETWYRESDLFGVDALRREFERDPWNPAVVQRYFWQWERAGRLWFNGLPKVFVGSTRALGVLHDYSYGYMREDELELLPTLETLLVWLKSKGTPPVDISSFLGYVTDLKYHFREPERYTLEGAKRDLDSLERWWWNTAFGANENRGFGK